MLLNKHCLVLPIHSFENLVVCLYFYFYSYPLSGIQLFSKKHFFRTYGIWNSNIQHCEYVLLYTLSNKSRPTNGFIRHFSFSANIYCLHQFDTGIKKPTTLWFIYCVSVHYPAINLIVGSQQGKYTFFGYFL